jgi:hypothetical protein
MTGAELTGLIILGFAMGAQLRLRSFLLSRQKLILSIAVLCIFGFVGFSAWQQYSVWHQDALAKFYLPPYQSWFYFISYVGHRFFAPWIISAVAGLLAWASATLLNKKYDERFFEIEEPFLFGIAVFATSYPVFLFYIVIMLLEGFLLSLFYALLKKGRAPLFYLWLPTAISVILIVHVLSRTYSLVKFNL